MPINFHIGGSEQSVDWLDRFPKLKFVSVESGIGWVPFILEALDYQLLEIAEGRRFDLKPSEYFRRNFYACFWFEQKDISNTLRQVGIDNALFETDFPHPTGLYPIENLEGRLSGLTAPIGSHARAGSTGCLPAAHRSVVARAACR